MTHVRRSWNAIGGINANDSGMPAVESYCNGISGILPVCEVYCNGILGVSWAALLQELALSARADFLQLLDKRCRDVCHSINPCIKNSNSFSCSESRFIDSFSAVRCTLLFCSSPEEGQVVESSGYPFCEDIF